MKDNNLNDITKLNNDTDQKKRGWKVIELPLTKVDKDYPFNFKVYNSKTDGIIFVCLAIIMPFLATILFSIFDMKNNATLMLCNLFIQFVCVGIAFGVILSRQGKRMWTSGAFAFYAFVIMPIFGTILLSIVFSFANINETSNPNYNDIETLSSLIMQCAIEIILITWVLFKTDNLKQRILNTFKTSWLQLLITVIIGSIILFVVSNVIFNFSITKIWPSFNEVSDNQSNLNNLLNGTGALNIISIISLFLFSVAVAPLCEELATRNAIFAASGNKTLAWFASALMFGYMHISQTGDFVHLITYLSAGICLATFFNMARGNVTYTWLIHMTYNLINFTIMVAV